MENSIEISSIPILNNNNYGEWSARIVILLRSKDLLHVCENSLPTDATVPVTNKWNKANSEAISIISSRVSHRVFIEVVKKYSKDAQQLWQKLEEQYASKKAINRGRVWMQWLRLTYDGDLQSYIDNRRMLMMSLDTVNINIPAECHSFTLLGKLSGDPKIHQFVEVLSLNKELIQQPELVLERLQEFHDNSKIQTSNHTPTPTALVSESSHPYKITYYCTNGKHNPMCTTHTKETCYAENPHLRPTHRNNKRKTRPYQNPSAHLSTAQVLITGERSNENPEELIIDCGATHHMFNSKHLFSSFVETVPIGVSTGDSSSSLFSKGFGTVNLLINGKIFTLEECLLVPNLNCNLISLMRFCNADFTITRSNNSFKLLTGNQVEIEGRIVNNLMKVKHSLPSVQVIELPTNLWHQRLGHPGNQVIKSMGLPECSLRCSTCDLNKAHKLPFNHKFESASKPLDCAHIDVVGPISPPSVSGNQYFLTVVDQATSFKIVRLLKHKSEAFKQFIIVKAYMENLHDRTLKKLVSDRGGEFLNKDFKSLAESNGFVHVFSPPETPQHNGFAERANRTIIEKTRCLINHSGLPKCYWAEALNTAVLLSNLVPTPSRFNLSPYSLWTGNSPRLRKLRVFGCRVTVFIPRSHWDWKCFWAMKMTSRHIGFYDSSTRRLEIVGEKEILDLGEVDEVLSQCPVEVIDEIHPTVVTDSEAVGEVGSATTGPVPRNDSSEVDEFLSPLEQANAAGGSSGNVMPSRIRVIGPRHPTIINGDIDQDNILTYTRRPKTLITKAADVPKTFRSALKGPCSDQWSKAIKKELGAMVDLKVWDVVDLKPDYRLVGTTWVFRLKTNHLKEITEYKARLCAQGFSQTPGVDFGKTYSPTGRLNSLRCLISFAVSKGLAFHQVDVKSAFLSAPLSEVVYLSIPQGLDLDKRKSCLRLKKEIYGLKQAPLAWYNSLKSWLAEVGFSVCLSDPCVFYRAGNSPIWLYVHVDDIAIFGNEVSSFKNELKSRFDIKDIGIADLMLGIKVSVLPDRISLDQEHFVEALLELYGMDSCKPMSTPLLPNTHLVPASDDEVEKFNALGVNFRSAVGSINYLSSGTRPDISHAVSSLSQFLEKPGYLHWQAFLHVLRYLKGTIDMGLIYRKSFPIGVKAWSDADWGNCVGTRRSVTGFLATLDGNLVLWKTRKQPSVSISTAEAEYKAVCDLASELIWLKQWGQECGIFGEMASIPIHEDNQGCISTINGDCSVNNKRMKHVDIQLHFIKEAVRNGVLKIVYTPTSHMLADFLTKSVSWSILARCLLSLGVLSLGVRGDVENQDQNQFDRQSATPTLSERHNPRL
ncbi:hypothetical protein O181_073823 [Austropuccinia psidii MF-1]|uniref:Integrase catalytic domain-containing protein n=1 Tax=Austropuccinia psidii MF-1 TaxID=1389203 RepID=A0A9Q3F5U5_9BASI|nr:hypothetical protein [Austropuccinia psidii MF-1]